VPVPLSEIASGEFGALLAIEALPVAAPAAVGLNFTVNEVLCPAFSVVAESPLMLNPAPDAEPDEIATLPVPVLVSVTDISELLPTAKLPKLSAAGFAVRCGCVPTPTRLTVRVGFDALLMIVTAPVALPAAAGANVAVKVVVWPAFRVKGASPLMLKPAPDATACEIAMEAAPEFVSVTDWLPLVPTVTFPYDRLPGVARRAALSVVPVPVSSRLCVEFGALSINLMLPAAPCAAEGANLTLKDTLLVAASVTGTVRPLIPKPAPEICAAFKTKSTFPLFVKVTGCVVLCPTLTFPNCSAPGETTSTGSVPVPVNATLRVEFAASLSIERLPFTIPAEGGASCT